MSQLSPTLCITFTNQRMREIRKEIAQTTPFAEVLTLAQFIETIAERFDSRTVLCEEILPDILHSIIKGHKLSWFDYAAVESDTIQTIADFLIKCAKNGVTISEFCSGEKHAALTTIQYEYDSFKREHSLSDSADRELFVRDFITENSDWKSGYSAILIDSFDHDDVHSYRSKLQKEILDQLQRSAAKLPSSERTSSAELIEPSIPAFDSFDEVRQALKIARKLLLEGVKPEDITIVTSDIEEYAPIFRTMLVEYGLKGWDSLGVSVKQYARVGFKNSKITEMKASVRTKLKTILFQATHLGLSIDAKRIATNLNDSSRILGEKIGIELTETNQLLGIHRIIPHIIFIGTDMEHFPPTSQGNFLFSVKDSVNHFFTNDYFSHSKAQVEHLRTHAEKLYIVTATYKGNQKLARSLLVPKCTKQIDISEIYAIHELIHRKETTSISNEIDSYIESAKAVEFTRFDGEQVDSVKVEHLSASRLNSYSDCPLKYLYKDEIKIESPQDTSEGFDVRDKGSLMHACFELFGRKVQAETILEDQYVPVMKSCAETAYKKFLTEKHITETIRHKVHFELLCKGLSDDGEKGALAKFLAYYRELKKNGFGFANSEFEYEFRLDKNLDVINQGSTKFEKDDTNYFIQGFVDRLDANPANVIIVDYKSTKLDSDSLDKKKQAKIQEIRDFQLALYILFAEQKWPKLQYDASLLTFKIKKKDWAEFAKITNTLPEPERNPNGEIKAAYTPPVEFNAEFRTNLKAKIHDFHNKMNSGHFGYTDSDETVCGYCNMHSFCHHSIFNKESAQ